MKRSRVLAGQIMLGVLTGLCVPAMADVTPPVAQRTNAPQAAESGSGPAVEKPAMPLPDEGPRLEGHAEGLEALAFQEGLSAYRREAWSQAHRFFEKVTVLQPPSPLAPAAMAFLAEAMIREDASNMQRLEGINLYKTLSRDYAGSQNGHRAGWRVGDLYLEQGWFQEALSMYARAAASEAKTPDGHRAMLGMGYANLALGRWADAVRAFQDLRKLVVPDAIQVSATLGLAHAYYRQGRMQDARVLYQVGYRRWPQVMRQDAAALQRYAGIEFAMHHAPLGRELLLLFYNLSPRDPAAPAALLRVAESLDAEDRTHSAELLYALLAAQHRTTDEATIAQMRLMVARSAQEAQAQRAGTLPDVVRFGSEPPLAPGGLDAHLRALAEQHPQDVIGNEALFHLARHHEHQQEMAEAIALYKAITARAETGTSDPWSSRASGRLAAILEPWIEAAQRSQDDLTVVTLFQRHGQLGARQYLGSPLLLAVADAHRRLGFTQEAGRLYQMVASTGKPSPIMEAALLNLGEVYLDQEDVSAAKRVLERARLQFPEGAHQREVRHRLLESMMRAQEWENALHFCRHWLLGHPRHPDRPWMYQRMAEVLQHLKKYDAAVIAYEEAFKAGVAKTPASLLAYAGALSDAKQYTQANQVYASVVETSPSADERDWARLQMIRGWRALKEYDRAQVVLAELGQPEDQLTARFASHLNEVMRQSHRQSKEEGL